MIIPLEAQLPVQEVPISMMQERLTSLKTAEMSTVELCLTIEGDSSAEEPVPSFSLPLPLAPVAGSLSPQLLQNKGSKAEAEAEDESHFSVARGNLTEHLKIVANEIK